MVSIRDHRPLGEVEIWLLSLFYVIVMAVSAGLGQQFGAISGKVLNATTRQPLQNVNVTLVNTSFGAASSASGDYTIQNVPPGQYHIRFSAVGFHNLELSDLEVSAGKKTLLNVTLHEEVITFKDIAVYGVSRKFERLLQAPAAVSIVPTQMLQQLSGTGQLPRLLENLNGVDIAQNGVNDFNINARGFNSSLNRRVLVLLDHRQTGTTFLGAQEWNTITFPNADLGKVEFIRGPGSALYGANAFSGVLNVTTPAPKDILGTRVSAAGGELNSIRGDVRHAGAFGPWSYKFNFGGMRSGNWARSRNISPQQLLEQEYQGLPTELFPLDDQDLSSVFANLRVDYATPNDGVITAEGGINQAQDQVFVTGIGRVQVDEVVRPWWRAGYSDAHIFTQIDYTGRKTLSGHQRALNSGLIFKEDSYDLHLQFQHTFNAADALQITWGVEHKFQSVDTDRTLTLDSYFENHSALFAQADLELSEKWMLSAAGRVDRSTLHPTQVSPKAAVIFTPNDRHSLRLSVSRAFQTPNYSEFFLYAPTGVPQDLIVAEDRIERRVEARLGMQPRTLDLPLDFGLTPFLAVGNDQLNVEKVLGFELGYKGAVRNKASLTADAYYQRFTDFITDLLPGVNPHYPTYQLPATIDPAIAPLVAEALKEELGENYPLFATTPDGSQAFVLSYTNAGAVNVWGVELGLNYFLTNDFLLDANYTFFDFDVSNRAENEVLLPNTPKHKFNLGVLYSGVGGFEASVYGKYVASFDWAAGIYRGPVPAYFLVDVSGGVWLQSDVRLGFVVSNLLNNEHYEMFGGSFNKRRALVSLTMTF